MKKVKVRIKKEKIDPKPKEVTTKLIGTRPKDRK